jgi:hypothetical protein
MWIRVSRVRAGGEPLAHITIVKVGGEQRFKPMLGVDIVAGLTSSGETELVHALNSLSRNRSALVGAVRAYSMGPEIPKLISRTALCHMPLRRHLERPLRRGRS